MRPERALIIAPKDRRRIVGVGVRVFRRKRRQRRGNSFCHVARIIHKGHDRPAMTFGNQRWAGAAPNLIIRPRRRSHLDRLSRAEGVMRESAPRRREKAPRVWVRRYLVAASCSGVDLD